MKFIVPRFTKIQKNTELVNEIIKENMIGVRVVKSFVREKKERQKFDDKVDKINTDIKFTGKIFFNNYANV